VGYFIFYGFVFLLEPSTTARPKGQKLFTSLASQFKSTTCGEPVIHVIDLRQNFYDLLQGFTLCKAGGNVTVLRGGVCEGDMDVESLSQFIHGFSHADIVE
jgi:hypothetical protein